MAVKERLKEVRMALGLTQGRHFNTTPDRGGNLDAIKTVNAEYDDLFSQLKDIHQTKEGETYTARQTTTETADQFK